MVGSQRLQMEPTKELNTLHNTPTYSDTLLAETLNSYTDCNSVLSDVPTSLGDITGNGDFLAEANFADVLYPCNEPVITEADMENWDLSSLLTAV